MSTRSFVGMMVGEKVRAVYVHFDGYLSGVGKDLQAFVTADAVADLLEGGDRSTLFGGFYDVEAEPMQFNSFEEFYKECKGSCGEYYYIWKDGEWYCGDTYDRFQPTEITRKLVPYQEAVRSRK